MIPVAKRKPRREPYQPPVALERIIAMIGALESGGELTPAQRREIVQALDCLFITLVIEEKQSTAGRRVSHTMQSCAACVNLLHTEHGLTVKAAACAVFVNGSAKQVEALLRCYRKMKAGSGFGSHQINDTVIANILARPSAKSGNK